MTTLIDLPDPESDGTITLAIENDRLRHVHHKHAMNTDERGCWGELLGTLLHRFDAWSANPQNDRDFPRAFAEHLRPALTNCLERPCIVAYDQFDNQTPAVRLHHTLEIVTRPGLIVVVRRLPARDALWTAFFGRTTCNEKNPNKRWKETVRQLVQRYALFSRVGNQMLYLHPEPKEHFLSDDPAGYRTNVRFISPREWGFTDFIHEGETLRFWKTPPPWAPLSHIGTQNPLKRK